MIIFKNGLKKIPYILLSFLFLSQIFMQPLFPPNLVLCMGDDHVAFEFQPLQTAHNYDGNKTGIQLKTQTKFHKEDCVDIPLFQHAQDLVTTRHFLTSQPICFPQTNLASKPIMRQQSFNAVSFSLLFPALQNTERSVILLI